MRWLKDVKEWWRGGEVVEDEKLKLELRESRGGKQHHSLMNYSSTINPVFYDR